MKPRAGWAASAIALAAVTACETTGDPRQGGLFGWSESKARERQEQRQTRVTGAETELNRESDQGAALQSRAETAEKNLRTAEAQRIQDEKDLRVFEASLLEKVDRFAQNSPTDATASRARAYRLKVSTIAAQKSMSARSRAERLKPLETEIDAALARQNR
jgi:hypothetical protein